MSPAVSKKQQKFFGAELGRKRAGKKTKTKMTEKQLEEFASTKRKGLPARKKSSKSSSNVGGTHMMPSGHRMSNAEMKRMMKTGRVRMG